MPQIGPLEILLVAAIALIVFGPDKLPEIARKVGRTASELRRIANEAKEEFQADFDFDEEDEEPPPRRAREPQPTRPSASAAASDSQEAQQATAARGPGETKARRTDETGPTAGRDEES